MTFCLTIIIYSLKGFNQSKSSQNFSSAKSQSGANTESYFKKINYDIVENNQLVLKLKADELIDKSEEARILFFAPDGIIISKSGTKVKFKSEKGILSKKENILFLEKNVIIEFDQTVIIADHAKYYINDDIFDAFGNVQTESISINSKDSVNITSDKLFSSKSLNITTFEGNVKGEIIRKKKYEEGMKFGARRVEYDSKKNIVSLFRQVFIKRNRFNAKARQGTIFLDNYSKRLKYFTLSDDVRLSEKVIIGSRNMKRTIQRKAISEKLEGNVREEIIILTGYPKVFQENDIVKGNKIILRENSDIVEVDDSSTNFIIK